MNRVLSLLLVIMLSIINLNSVFAENKIRFGVIYFYPPFAFSAQSGYVHGFDIDIATAICQQLKAVCTFKPMPLTQLFTSLNQNEVDAIIGAISITPSRLSSIMFTEPYFKSTMSFVTLTANQIDLNNLSGKKVGVIKDSTFQTYLLKKYGNLIKLTAFTTNEQLMMALSDKAVDLVLIDTPAANYWVGYSTGLFKTVGKPEFLNIDQGYGIGVKKHNPLVNSLNAALNTIKQNGTLTKIKQANAMAP